MEHDENLPASLKGENVSVKIWSPLHAVESEALSQLRNLTSLPWVYHHIAAMPDVHAGKGCTVGSVIPMRGALAPAAVGVDIGCVDRDTEYLSPVGWRKIGEWSGDAVMQYDPATGIGRFVTPNTFIKLPCDEFLHIHTKYGVNQMLSEEHKVLFRRYTRAFDFRSNDIISAGALAQEHEQLGNGFRGRFITTFTPDHERSLDLTNEELRVMVMVMADGNYPSADLDNKVCRLHFKKQRKIDRAIALLEQTDITFEYRRELDGTTRITFEAPIRSKSMWSFWDASLEQLHIIADEVLHWDGNFEEQCFYTRLKASADFMSYCFAATGKRSVVREDVHPRDGGIDYRVFAQPNTIIGINGSPKTPITRVPSPDGFKYCFTVPSGFWVMRRGGVIAMTGNCGMGAVRTNLHASDLPEDLTALRHQVERDIPVGINSHKEAMFGSSRIKTVDPRLVLEATTLFDSFSSLDARAKASQANAMRQVGTLGGGNHFIELCLDEGVCETCSGYGMRNSLSSGELEDCPQCSGTGKVDPRVWMMLHSGSRNIGKVLAEVHIAVAKSLAHNEGIVDADMAAFLAGTPEMQAYRHDLYWAQSYAFLNRRVMFALYKLAMMRFFPSITFDEPILCHHNYVAEEVHFGEKVFLTRKGAIDASKGTLGIIPGSMGTRSYIVRGLGNPESFNSASHGAGRRMSRGQAKRTFTLDDLKAQTAGVCCRKDGGVLDEIPGAYKDIDQVMANQKDLVEVLHTLKQVMCIKG